MKDKNTEKSYMCVYVCMCVCVCVCVCVYVCMQVCMYVCMCMHMCVRMGTSDKYSRRLKLNIKKRKKLITYSARMAHAHKHTTLKLATS